MRKLLNKIIIWLFEKYAFDYWIEQQEEEENKRLMIKYKVKRDELDDLRVELLQQERDNYCRGNSFGL